MGDVSRVLPRAVDGALISLRLFPPPSHGRSHGKPTDSTPSLHSLIHGTFYTRHHYPPISTTFNPFTTRHHLQHFSHLRGAMNGSCLFHSHIDTLHDGCFLLFIIAFLLHSRTRTCHSWLFTQHKRRASICFLPSSYHGAGNEGQRHTTIITIIIIMGKGHLPSRTQKKEKSTKNTGLPQIDGPQRKHTPPMT